MSHFAPKSKELLPLLIKWAKNGQDVTDMAKELYSKADSETIREALAKVRRERDKLDGDDTYFPVKYGKQSAYPSLSVSNSKLYLLYHYLFNRYQDTEHQRLPDGVRVQLLKGVMNPKYFQLKKPQIYNLFVDTLNMSLKSVKKHFDHPEEIDVIQSEGILGQYGA